MASHGVPRAATLEQRTTEEREDERQAIERYRSLVELIEAKILERQYTVEVLHLTSQLLTENPEYYTIWNARRRLLISGPFFKSSGSSLPLTGSPNSTSTSATTTFADDSSSSTANSSTDSKTTPRDPTDPNHGKNGTTLELIKNELNFVMPLLKKWPKCYWIWGYRIWLLNQATERLDASTARKLWQGELALVGMMLVRDSRNFHGWGYRRMVVQQLESLTLEGKSMVESEFDYTTKMITAHLSNFSAWHARSKLIPRLLNERQADDAARKSFLDEEFDLMRNALWTDPADQSLWFYYQFLMATLTNPFGHAVIVPNFTQTQRIDYVQQQFLELKDMLDGAEDCKWIYNALLEYTLALAQMQDRSPSEVEKADMRSWQAELRKLDPFRTGRWDALEDSFKSLALT